jgi:predicted HTH domain antitoxin
MAIDRRVPDVDDEELALLVGQYALGERTLGQTAERAGVSQWQMREILQDVGVELRTGPEDEEAARDEVDTVL